MTDAAGLLYSLLTPSLIRAIKTVEMSKPGAPNPCISYDYGLFENAKSSVQSSLSFDSPDNNFASVVFFLKFLFDVVHFWTHVASG